MTAMKHACFLRDPRTDVVVGEPRSDLPIVPKLKLFLPQEFNRVGVSLTTFDLSGQLTAFIDRNSNSRTRDQYTSYLGAIVSSKLLHCIRTENRGFRCFGFSDRRVGNETEIRRVSDGRELKDLFALILSYHSPL